MSYSYFMLVGTIITTNPDSVVILSNGYNIRVYFDNKLKSTVSEILKPSMHIGLRGELEIVDDKELRLVATRIASWG